MLNTALAVQTGQPQQYLLEEAQKWNCRCKTWLLSGTLASFEKVAEGETAVQVLFIFCNMQNCNGSHSMAGRLWDCTAWRKTLTSTWKLYEFCTLWDHTLWYMNYIILHELYNFTFGCGKAANATVVLGLPDTSSSQKNHLCNPL